MSFIQELIEVSNENDAVDARKNIPKLILEIKRHQHRTKAYIETNYVDFLSNLNGNEVFLDDGEKLIREVEDILQNIESDTKHDLYSATEELKQYIEELQEIALGLRTSNKILKIDELFQSIDAAKSNNEYLTVMDITSKIKTLIDDPTDKIFLGLDCYQNIKIKYHIESEMLLHNLKQCFEQLVQFTEKHFQSTKSVTLKISKDENQLLETVIALFNARYNPKKLCDFLLEKVFEPIITKPVSIEFNEDGSDFVQLSLSYSLKDLGDNLRPNYKIVFKNLEIIMNCLDYMNVPISDTLFVLQIFGEEMKEKFLNLLINECLMYSIPDTMDEMNESTLVDDILEFNRFLIKSFILNKDIDFDLINYAEKIGILFRNRFCTSILDNAIEIMRKDLHNMTLIADQNTSEDASDDPFMFPRCMVSKSTMELINLMEKVIRQAESAEEDVSKRLISTIPTILDVYLTEVPKHHEKLLQNIPQHTALFHNNCMYLAHWLTKNSDKGIESIAIIVKNLQTLGSEHLMSQIKNQRTQLLQILKSFDLFNAVTELGIGPQKLVRQCLRQLDLLKNVWQTVLPDVVYSKTMCNLLNDVCSEIIKRVLALEDIPSTIATELAELCGMIIEHAPKIFQEEHQVMQVKSWMKLKQLKMILGASLAQITEQWSEGKGPLTLNFKAEEVKHLIRALFQNTSRRAGALASIV